MQRKIEAVIAKASKSFKLGLDNDREVLENPQLRPNYKFSNFDHLTVKGEPFVGDGVRIPGTHFVASSGPQNEHEVMMLISDTVLDQRKAAVMKLISDYLVDPDNKQKVMKLISDSIASLPNKNEIILKLVTYATSADLKQEIVLKSISEMIGNQLILRPTIRHIVAFADHVACHPSIKKDFYDYCLVERILENDNLFIKVKNINGTISMEEYFIKPDGTVNIKDVKDDEFEKYAQYPISSVCLPLSPVVRSQLIVKDKSNKQADPETIDVNLFKLQDMGSINLKKDDLDDNISDEKKKNIIESTIENLWRLYEISQKEPVLVHCKAGVGRTGHFILMMEILKHYDDIFGDDNVDAAVAKIDALVKNIRQVRPGLISIHSQLEEAIYNAHVIHEYALKKGYIKNIKPEENVATEFPSQSFATSMSNESDLMSTSAIETKDLPFDKRPKLINSALHAHHEYSEMLQTFVNAQVLNDRTKESEIHGELTNLFNKLNSKCNEQYNYYNDLSSKNVENLKIAIEQMNQNIRAVTPFKTDMNIIEVDDAELEFLVHDRREFNRRYNIAIKQTVGYLVSSHAGNSIMEALSWILDTFEKTDKTSTEIEKYQQLLALFISNECFYTVDYLLSKDPNVEQTLLWLKEQGLDPKRETKERRYAILDNPHHNRGSDNNVSSKKKDDIDYLTDESFASYLESQGCDPLKIQQFHTLAWIINKPIGEAFESVLIPQSDHYDIYEQVIKHKLDLLLEYFPFHSQISQFSVELKENTTENVQKIPDIQENKSNNAITLDTLSLEELAQLNELSGALGGGWDLGKIFESITTSYSFYNMAVNHELFLLLDYFPKDAALHLSNEKPINSGKVVKSKEEDLQIGQPVNEPNKQEISQIAQKAPNQMDNLAVYYGQDDVMEQVELLADAVEQTNEQVLQSLRNADEKLRQIVVTFEFNLLLKTFFGRQKDELKEAELKADIMEQIELLADAVDQTNEQVLQSLRNADEELHQVAIAFEFNLLLKTFFEQQKDMPTESEEVIQTQAPQSKDNSEEIKLNQIGELAEMIGQEFSEVKKSLENADEMLYEVAMGLGFDALLAHYFPQNRVQKDVLKEEALLQTPSVADYNLGIADNDILDNPFVDDEDEQQQLASVKANQQGFEFKKAQTQNLTLFSVPEKKEYDSDATLNSQLKK